MKRSCLLIAAALFATSSAMADDTGPTHPDKARQNPLDSSEPRQEVIEQRHDDMRKPEPPADDDDLDPSRPERRDGEPSAPTDGFPPANTGT